VRPRPPRRLAVVAALLATTVLAGCASLPESGPVQQGDPDVVEPGSVALVARRPAPGDSPTEIVEGFLRASAAGFTDDFTVARTFLDGPVQASWNPLAEVRVYAGQARTEEVGERQAPVVEASAALSGRLDDAGRYTEAAPGTPTTALFALAENDDGEWRIVALEDGVTVSEPLFRSLFEQTALYFVTPDAQVLVPETRWSPRGAVETAAARELLAGPSTWLAPGVVTAFPPGTRLVVDAVAVRDGVAHVDLSAEALQATPQERVLMLAQLTHTLVPLPRVRDVEVTVQGAPFETPAVEPDLVVDPTVGTVPVVLADGLLQRVESGSLVPLEGVGAVTANQPSHPALPYDDAPPVVLSAATSLVTVPREGPPGPLLADAGPLTPPSYDRHGWVWTAPAGGGAAVHAVRPDGTRVDVGADWLAGRQVRSLRVARDGARVLVVSVADGDVVVEVAAVVRDADATPTLLPAPLRIAQRATDAGPAAWVDQQTVAVLGRVAQGEVRTVLLVPVGGATTPLPPVEGTPVSLASGKGDRLLFVGTSDGELFERNGVGWTATVGGVSDPAFPG
jgi:hypothetical protein